MDIQDIIDKITECAEANGWHVHTERYRDTDLWLFEFSQYTKAGQDFNFSAEMRYADPETLIKSVREYYENYDPDEEAYLWIGDDGHGKNGAPYRISDMKNLVKTGMNFWKVIHLEKKLSLYIRL
ncbi:hypothetical protein ACMYZ5_02520 [Bacteroides sp. KG68]|uniref:hypothetical protein n=1 Tax=unclassified Bacteroides TaxID=2646097 RepID=UPI003D98E00A